MMKKDFDIQNWFESRSENRKRFLKSLRLEDAALVMIGEDCASRRYGRLEKDGKKAVLMEALPDDHPHATPGHKVSDFIRIADYLRGKKIRSPKIYAADKMEGYVLLEDFGDVSFKKALQSGENPRGLYKLAVDALLHMRNTIKDNDLNLPAYYESAVHKGRRRIVDWYIPAVRQRKNPDGLLQSYLDVWDKIESGLPRCPQGFLHGDYHFENLMLLEGGEGINRCGVLDFQGAMWGPLSYDLGNLLEDVRVDVDRDIRDEMLDYYCCDMGTAEEKLFRQWYRILTTQFHCRVIGQFIKLALVGGKDRYLDFIPQTACYIRQGIEDPLLEPLKKWFADHEISFEAPLTDIDNLANLICDDAF